MMDGVHDDGEEGGDYFFPLGVTQEAPPAAAEGGGGEEGDHLGISHDARLRSLMISAELTNDKLPNWPKLHKADFFAEGGLNEI